MKYRELGNTGLKVSEIALGCEGFVYRDEAFTEEMFKLAMAAGINCMDLYSPNPDLHRRMGKILEGRRDKFVIQGHLCTVWEQGQYKVSRRMANVKRSFESMMENLKTDYLDVGMIHYVDSVELWESIANGEIMAYAQELKAKGIIKHIGLSSHNPDVALAAVNSGLIEVLMFSVNPCYDLLPASENIEELWAEKSYSKPLFNLEPKRELLYETCQRLGVGITVMKAFGGGQLLSKYSPAGMALTPIKCIHYALTRPGVTAVMSGVQNVQNLLETLRYETASDEEKDYAVIFSKFPKISWSGHCMYCGHCAPCPKKIEVATVTKFLNLAKAQGELPETVREHYAALEAKASDCIECGACETRCPFQVPIMDNMKKAKEIFGY